MSHPLVPRRDFLPAALLLAGALACSAGDQSKLSGPGDTTSTGNNQKAPSAPSGVTATAGDGQATVSWQAPQSAGSSAITSYTVVASPGNDSVLVAAPSTQAIVSGLTNGTAYTFVVRAKNSVGAGPASAASNAVTPKVVTAPPPSGRWVSGYYVAYQRNMYSESTVDFTYMTHVIVGAIEATATGGVTTDFLIGASAGPALAKTVSTRAHAANRKAILMLGGAGFRDNLLASATNYRAAFVTNLLAAMDSLGYDGIDVDWEPVISTDQPVLLQLFKDLRTARPNIILTFPVDWSWYAPSAWYVQVAGVVDQINIMSYGMADAWSGWSSWHSSALVSGTASEPSSITRSINAYLAAGVPAAKLGVGIGAYGSCWRGPTAPGQAPGSGVVAGDNTMSYAAIMSSYYSAAAFKWDSTAKAPYLSSATGLGGQACNFVSYEDPQSIAAKGAYVKSQGLGGAMMWTINEGHLSTAPTGQQGPLLAAAYNAIVP